ncbi:DUF4127 family protein [Chitinimonas sp. BJYL2]|uniref:DUF4127 family protein n=1 Tax=Chitinimonas sp. BJYL2 TaxID=2976696 RepID=UPI0022B531D8|nr:DUF4127 family protein [Chitinimonas sp. BJYL2]
MNPRIVALPVDGRPVVREQVQWLVDAAGWQLRTPPVAALGHLRTPADRRLLSDWLIDEAEQAEGFVISLDMLCYGGLVPSRFIEDSFEDLVQWLAVLFEIRQRYPAKPIYAFAATMRLSNNNVNEEEKLYWREHGETIWRWSFHRDRFEQLGQPDDERVAEAAEAAIPAAIRQDYLLTRTRNYALTKLALEMVEHGVIDRLILPQDDTAEYGFNIAERRQLQAAVSERGLADRVAIYPGADEVIHTLCAHLHGRLSGTPALRVYLHPSDPAHIVHLHALYEDRPVLESVSGQIAAVGGEIVTDVAQADLILAVHTQGTAQGDWAMRKPLAHAPGVAVHWYAQLLRWHEEGKRIAVADLAYANGGDPLMINALAEALPLNCLAGYSGWNTAGNTLGGLLAQCALCRSPDSSANRHNLALRLLEDLLYQAVLRQTFRIGVDESQLDAEARRVRIADLFMPFAEAFAQHHQLGYRVCDVYLPWDRSFEIGLRLEATA